MSTFPYLGKTSYKSSEGSQRQFLTLWGDACQAPSQIGKQTAAPDAPRKSPRVQSRLLCWAQFGNYQQKPTFTPASRKPGLASALRSLWLLPVLGWGGGDKGRGRGGRSPFVGGSHEASFTLHFPGLHLPGPASQGVPWGHGRTAGEALPV